MAHRMTRRELVSRLTAGTAVLVATGSPRLLATAREQRERFRVDANVRQLFLDDEGICRARGVKRVLNRPQRHPENPLLTPDTTWERDCQVYGTAYFNAERDRYKLWYLTGPKDRGLKPIVLWTPHAGNPALNKYCDTNQNVVYDPRIRRYVGFSRFGFGRRLARSESDDFVHWSPPELVLECDVADGPGTQIYGAGVDLYEGVYLAMIWIYREGGDGKIDTQLATSRDGIRWTRVANRATWLNLGDAESWEGKRKACE